MKSAVAGFELAATSFCGWTAVTGCYRMLPMSSIARAPNQQALSPLTSRLALAPQSRICICNGISVPRQGKHRLLLERWKGMSVNDLNTDMWAKLRDESKVQGHLSRATLDEQQQKIRASRVRTQ